MTEINPAKLEEKIEDFKAEIKKRNSSIFGEHTLIRDLKDHTKEDDSRIHPAVRLAYLDAKRTMSNIGKKYSAERDQVLKDIETALHDYFFDGEGKTNPAPDTETIFDGVHDSLCKKWCETFKRIDKEIGTYGKAQKIVNMSFKYLYCCDDASNYKKHFEYCHMPLDSFTLEWFKRDVTVKEWYENEKWPKKNPRIVSDKMAAWSALEYDLEDDPRSNSEVGEKGKIYGYYSKDGKKKYYSYLFYLKNIRKHIEKNKYQKDSGDVLSPLELEFIVWPESQKHLAAEGFLIGLKGISKKEDKKEIRDKSLEVKYKDIIEFLIDNGYREDILKFLTKKGYKIVAPDEIKEKAAKAE